MRAERSILKGGHLFSIHKPAVVPFFTHTWIFPLASSWIPDQVVFKHTKEKKKENLAEEVPKELGGLKHGGTYGSRLAEADRGPFICLNVHLRVDCSIEYKMALCLPRCCFILYCGQNLHFMIDTLHHRNDPKPSLIQCTGRPPPCCTSKTVKNAPSLLTSYFGKHRVKSICQILTT